MNHSFDVQVAAKYGLNEAILFNNISYWILKNKANNTNFYDNNYWTYNSYKAFTDLFPYFSERQVRYAIDNLIKKGLIIKDNFNIKNYDNKNCYALTPKGWELVDGTDKNFKASDNNDTIPLTNLSDRVDKNVRPIPNINTNINSNINICATSKIEVAPTPTKYKFSCKPSKSNKNTEWILSQEDLNWYQETYKNLDIDLELKKMWRWLKKNNLKTYQGMGRFVSSWLSRANDSYHKSNNDIDTRYKEARIKEIEQKTKNNIQKTNEMFARAEEFEKFLGGTKNDKTGS